MRAHSAAVHLVSSQQHLRVFLLISFCGLLCFFSVFFFSWKLLIESRSFEVVGSGSCRGVVVAVVHFKSVRGNQEISLIASLNASGTSSKPRSQLQYRPLQTEEQAPKYELHMLKTLSQEIIQKQNKQKKPSSVTVCTKQGQIFCD